jgi:protein-tyrosine kinase
MARHNNLASHVETALNKGFLPMAEDKSAARAPQRHASASLFRPGQTTEYAPLEAALRASREIFTDNHPLTLFNPARIWESLNAVTLDGDFLAGNGLFTRTEDSAAGPAFDILRTRVAQAMAARGWKRIGITSPTHGCGKSFTAANLALSLARRPGSRTVLIDLDLRRPGLHRALGLTPHGPLREVLDGSQPMEGQFIRVGRSLALGLNAEPAQDAGDILHSKDTGQALAAIAFQLDPDLMIFDLPPTLVGDDVIAMADKMDAVLIVADGTKTTAKEIRACEALLEGRIPLLGVVLNHAQDSGIGRLRDGKR